MTQWIIECTAQSEDTFELTISETPFTILGNNRWIMDRAELETLAVQVGKAVRKFERDPGTAETTIVLPHAITVWLANTDMARLHQTLAAALGTTQAREGARLATIGQLTADLAVKWSGIGVATVLCAAPANDAALAAASEIMRQVHELGVEVVIADDAAHSYRQLDQTVPARKTGLTAIATEIDSHAGGHHMLAVVPFIPAPADGDRQGAPATTAPSPASGDAAALDFLIESAAKGICGLLLITDQAHIPARSAFVLG